MVKNFIIKIITSLVKVQMLQQDSSLPRVPPPPRGLVLTALCPHKVAGVSARARQGEGRLPAGLSPWLKAKGRMQTPAQMERHLHTFYIIYKETGIPGNMISTPNALPDWWVCGENKNKTKKRKVLCGGFSIKNKKLKPKQKNLPSFEQTPDFNFEKWNFVTVTHKERRLCIW